MATKLNLHKLMGAGEGYLDEIAVEALDRRTLAVAREMIRDTLRGAFRDWSQYLLREELLGKELAATGLDPQVPRPKFRIQGSFAYHTVNDCQNPPGQQIDQDDGVFLPQSFVLVGNRVRPTIASAAYFKLVEKALAPLCRREGWILNPVRKGSCVRVEIDERLHIDLPLYAIKDDAFEQLVEFAAAESLTKSLQMRDSIDLDDRIYRTLAEAEIMLAHRDDGWIESDPRKLEDWFENAVELHGPIVRELSRCFKGMRDARFDGGLSSICIMALVVSAAETIKDLDPARLDVALAKTARAIARQVEQPVGNPAFPDDIDKLLCKDWTPDYRQRVRELFLNVAERMDAAIDGTFHKGLALGHATAAFGERVPANEDLIAIGGAVAAVRSTPAQVQPKPTVPRTQSG